MKEIELDYGNFEPVKNNSTAKSSVSSDGDVDFNTNIDALNAHFSAKDKLNEKLTLQEENSDSENISVVAAVEESDAVNIEVSKSSENKGKLLRHGASIGEKLIAIISTIVVISMGVITFLVSLYVTRDTRVNAENSNLTLNSRTASDCENRINSVISTGALFCELFDEESYNVEELENKAKKFFDKNNEIALIGLGSRDTFFVNKNLLLSKDIPLSTAEAFYMSAGKSALKKAALGSTLIDNVSPFFASPMISIAMPVNAGETKKEVIVVFSSEQLAESISTGKINESMLVNEKGVVLIHPDSNLMMMAEDLSANEFVSYVIKNKSSGFQHIYFDENGDEYFAACKMITDANCRVITQVKASVILAAIEATTRRNIALTVAVLSIAILIIWAFSKSLSIPLKNLTAVTDEINKGNFNTDLFEKLNTSRRDEIGILNQSTKLERDILNTVTSLTNRGVTKAIVRKEIDFEPHLKDVTVFFSDIRGFTEISDGFSKRFGEKSAAGIISFLNDYMSRMINCISLTGGVVDKFEGDAIMAAWGVLNDDSLDFEQLSDTDENKKILKEKHENKIRRDAMNAIKSTVAMRYALMKYNKDAAAFTKEHADEPLAQYKPHIRIGCGLNSGRATVGFMGSNDKMEFTSIGDAVNLASRTESSTKPCGVDILITEDTYNLLKTDFIKCKENKFTLSEDNLKNEIVVEVIPVTFSVKGKGEQHFYGVVNMPSFDIGEFFKSSDPDFTVDQDCAKAVGPDGPKTLSQVRKLLGIKEPDFASVNLDEKENKVSVK